MKVGKVDMIPAELGQVEVVGELADTYQAHFICPYCKDKSRIGKMRVRSFGGVTILECLKCEKEYIRPTIPHKMGTA